MYNILSNCVESNYNTKFTNKQKSNYIIIFISLVFYILNFLFNGASDFTFRVTFRSTRHIERTVCFAFSATRGLSSKLLTLMSNVNCFVGLQYSVTRLVRRIPKTLNKYRCCSRNGKPDVTITPRN